MRLSEEFYAAYEKLCDEEIADVNADLVVMRRHAIRNPEFREMIYETRRCLKNLEQERIDVRTLRDNEKKCPRQNDDTDNAVWSALTRPEDLRVSSGRIGDNCRPPESGENNAGDAIRVEPRVEKSNDVSGVLA
jgi:hypothetical protein